MTRIKRIERIILRVVSSHSPPVSTVHIFDIGMKVSPVAISTNSNKMATIPNAVNNRVVRLRDGFIPGVCNNKVNRKQVPDGKYESDHATPHQDEQLLIPNNHCLPSMSVAGYCCKLSFPGRL